MATVKLVTTRPYDGILWDLTVEGAHTFFVGSGQWLVHNCDLPAARQLAETAFGTGDVSKVPGLKLEAAAQYPGKVGRIENHHIVPKYLGGPANGPTVPLPASYHQKITNEFRSLWGYGQDKPSIEQLETILNRVYEQYPISPFR